LHHLALSLIVLRHLRQQNLSVVLIPCSIERRHPASWNHGEFAL
jgi:hypothetical protein